MRAPFRSLLLALAVAAAGAAAYASVPGPQQQEQPQPQPQPAPPREQPVPLLWQVSDADNSVYLLGSFHLLRPDDYPLSVDVDAAFADAESLVFELPPEEMASPGLAVQMGQAALRTDGTRLDSQLPPATAGRLRDWLADNAAHLQPMGLTGQVLQMFEPWFVALTVSLVEMGKHGLDSKLGLDAHFAAAAHAAGKPATGLETGAQQIAFLDGMDVQEQLQFVDEALVQAGEGTAEIEQLHAAWRKGDAEALWDGMAADMRERYPALYQRINVERNDAWVPRIEQRLQQPGSDDTLVVVGALHLLGTDGVVEKLRARGYSVARVCSACPPAPGQVAAPAPDAAVGPARN